MQRTEGEGGGESGGQAGHGCLSQCSCVGFSPACFPSLTHPHFSGTSQWTESDLLHPAVEKTDKEDRQVAG